MPNGYAGKILHVDLTQGTTWTETPPEGFYRKYMGGSAMGMHYILNETRAGVDALGPDNVLTLMVSPFTGAPISGQSRMCANARSPLADGIGDAQCGGFFPAEMKYAGFDGIVVRGRASRPVYLWLHDGQAEIRDASHLTGQTTSQAEDAIKQELADNRIQVAQCGPAGERLARVACIINMANRANGRTGMGAVMGSKNLRAVAVRGTSRRLTMADAKKVGELARWGTANVSTNLDVLGMRDHGTAAGLPAQNATGTLPTRNWNEGQFEHFEAISGERMTETILKERDTCYACAVQCKRVVETEWNGRPVEARHGGPEYETIATLGSYCGIGDLAAISYANKLCNEYGLDTIGTGATIAWAMECFENGLLTQEEIGSPLQFGDAEAMVRMLEMIASRQGFGDILAEGSRRAADRLGKGHDYLITIKGTEAPAHMPQAKRSLALIYAVNPFGTDHQSSEHDPMVEDGASDLYMGRLNLLGFDHTLPPASLDADKARFVFETQRFYSFLDSAALCQFVWGPAWTLFGPRETVDFVRAVTGWQDFSLDELLQVGERRMNLMRAFNAREGLDRKDDRLPGKFLRPLQGTGPTAGVKFDEAAIEAIKDVYYQLAGWDTQTGNPTRSGLARLDLEWVADLLDEAARPISG